MLLVAVGCGSTNLYTVPTATSLPTPRSRLALRPPADAGVVVVAVPGLEASTLSGLRERDPSPVPTIERLLTRGRQSALMPVQPPLPAPSLASLATGALPAEHTAVSGALDVGILGEPPLWQRAEEAGKTTAVVGWPHATDPPSPSVWVARTGRFAVSARHTVTLQSGAGSWEGVPSSETPPAEGRFPLRRAGRDVGEVWVLALDTVVDNVALYDTILFDLDRRIGPETARLQVNASDDWVSLRVAEDAGIDIKLLAMTGQELVLYQSEAIRFGARPAELATVLRAQLGFYPPDGDRQAYDAGWLTSEDLLRMSARQTEWLAAVAAFSWRTYAPDLLMTYWPIVMQVEPALLLVDSAQPGWQPQRENDLGDVRRRAVATVDGALRSLLRQTDLSRTSFFLASPYSYAPVHTQIDLVALLEEWELLLRGPDGTPNWAEAPLRLVVEEGIAWVWPAPGVEAPAQFRAERRRQFTELTDPLNGQRPVATVLSDEALTQTALWTNVTRGALFVQLQPGYRFVLGDGNAVFEHTTRYGAAGYSATAPQMRGWLLAAGWRIRPGETAGAPPSALDVPATAARLLDVPWPLQHGTSLDEWLDYR